MYFQRAARTDKSVSAIKQIVSIKIMESITNRLNDVNKLLPDDIRLMGCKRVTQAFDAKNYCDARTYSYLMPSFALCPVTEVATESYRAPKEVIDLLNTTLEGYLGTHIFHNFTSGKSFKEDSSARLIRYMKCSEPFFPCNQSELEFVVIRVKGQSFMMHQIRKMIGLAIAVVKGFATEDHIKRSMEEGYMDIPKAPGLGLMLEEAHFDRYNRKYGGDGHHEPIEWEAQNDAIEKFKDEYIYPVVVETEKKEKSMFHWLHTLSLHSYGTQKVVQYPPEVKHDHARLSLQALYDPKPINETSTDDVDESHSSKKIKLGTDSEERAQQEDAKEQKIEVTAN